MHTWGKGFAILGILYSLYETISGGLAAAGSMWVFLGHLIIGPILVGGFCYIFGLFLYVAFIKRLFGLD